MLLLQRATRTILIVFAHRSPGCRRFFASLAQPGGTITGFTTGEYAVGGGKLQVLKEIRRHVAHVAVLLDLLHPLKSASPMPSRLPRRPYKCV